MKICPNLMQVLTRNMMSTFIGLSYVLYIKQFGMTLSDFVMLSDHKWKIMLQNITWKESQYLFKDIVQNFG